jgi:excinuclease ABC subunit B
MKFRLQSSYSPIPEQKKAVEKLSENIKKNIKYQTLLGVTGMVKHSLQRKL